jgi:hypothetical protein
MEKNKLVAEILALINGYLGHRELSLHQGQ